MRNRKLFYTVLSCVVICVIAVSVLLLTSGAPAINTADYVKSTTEPTQGTELVSLTDSSKSVPGMTLVAQNKDLALYYHAETTEVAVLNKNDGHIWYSNPQARDEDAKASAYEKEVLSSQLSISFRDAIATLDQYNNFTQSISKGQFAVQSIENGIRLTYTLGDKSLGIDAMPKYISKQRFEEKILSKLDEGTSKYASGKYYPTKNDPEVLERLDAQISKQLVLNKMLAAFTAAGYTEEDLAFDNEENGNSSGATSNKPNFVIPLEYRLDGDSLVVTVPTSQIQESAGYKIRDLELLNFFGAAGLDDRGYIFVPDGSGSLIYLNNGKVKEEGYVQRVYGADPNDNSISRGQVSENARMPVFGLKTDNGAWLAIIELGDGIASVSADISGKQNSYNRAHSIFAVRGEDILELYTGDKIQDISLLTDEMFKGDIQVRYNFLGAKQSSYSDMAKLYQDKLVEQSVLKPLEDEKNIPFYLDILGAIDRQESFLGVPYDGMISMTSFNQAANIAEQLNKDGVSNLQMRYLGWFNKGVKHKLPVNVKTDSVLGSKKELTKLSEQLEQSGGTLYPDVAFQNVYHDDFNFSPSSDAARFITKEEVELTPFNRALNRMDMSLGTYYLLSAAKLPYYVDEFIDSYKSYKQTGVSLRDLGDVLASDYRSSRLVYRDTAKNIVVEQVDKIRNLYPNLMLTGGNSYVWKYASHLIDVPTSSSRFNITDESVPFYQMVLHGYIDYAGIAVNLDNDQDVKRQLLQAIEMGAAPHFLWSYEPSSELKYTRYDSYYSTNYKDWYDQAVSMYQEADRALSGLRTKRIIEHICHQEGVFEVKYEGGVSVIVNYTKEPVFVGGISIGAQDYAVGGDQG